MLEGKVFFSSGSFREHEIHVLTSHVCYKEGKVTSKYFSFILNSLPG